jgi:hypothetical protein
VSPKKDLKALSLLEMDPVGPVKYDFLLYGLAEYDGWK